MRDVHKSYAKNTDALNGVTIDIKDGEFVFVKFNKPVDGSSKLYGGSLKDGKTESLKFYKDKAERFQKEFKKNH